jgi:hypothetical protein
MKLVKCVAFTCVALAGLTGSVHAKPNADREGGAAAVSASNSLDGLTRSYYAASDKMRPGIARSISRQLRMQNGSETDRAVQARALLVVSQHAALDARKDLALQTATQALRLAESGSNKALQAGAHVALTRALILQEQYVDAVETISNARIAYGPMGSLNDSVWDELAMYEVIALAALPARLSDAGRSVALSPDQRLTLTGARGAQCGGAQSGVVRLENVGLNPFTRALNVMLDTARGGAAQNLLSADTGFRDTLPVTAVNGASIAGIAVRSDLDAQGRVVASSVSAYAPLQHFAAAAQVAAPTWQFALPSALDPDCRRQVLTVLAFKAR